MKYAKYYKNVTKNAKRKNSYMVENRSVDFELYRNLCLPKTFKMYVITNVILNLML